MYGIEHGMGWGLGGFGMLLVWLVPILLVVLLVRAFIGRSAGPDDTRPRKTPLEMLDERYARGEFERDEYLKRRGDLAH
ncbi:MAG: SHOCT domain-containing protein [Gammaproteobacteria bacterium]|nr:SHOCT domain-containing protein [Rhodocyclaceae bacterium]MBU3909687.1 SHOCT domain-containing protein [Gammaproteobacteria bacterium]MBU3988037.1 SHOCT domain-containing protein [Gammaproteobacteria bacterium]MBU4005220.1 SHOCT domain-containing protein [Gammaproteobacteria bacterium]MBU4022399.1 SHOCT domain-containing protein [Gammaproteobacteria bacterium]